MPQLPTITVVTPCEILGSMVGRPNYAGVVMRMNVDESRSERQAVRIQSLGCAAIQ